MNAGSLSARWLHLDVEKADLPATWAPGVTQWGVMIRAGSEIADLEDNLLRLANIALTVQGVHQPSGAIEVEGVSLPTPCRECGKPWPCLTIRLTSRA